MMISPTGCLVYQLGELDVDPIESNVSTTAAVVGMGAIFRTVQL